MLTAYRITYSDGSTNTTSMAKGITLEDAKAYFLGKWFDVGVYPVENMQLAVKVEKVA